MLGSPGSAEASPETAWSRTCSWRADPVEEDRSVIQLHSLHLVDLCSETPPNLSNPELTPADVAGQPLKQPGLPEKRKVVNGGEKISK
jgi:hypothetical protein